MNRQKNLTEKWLRPEGTEMYDLLLFAGTSEGHRIADFCAKNRIRACVFTATAYGKNLISPSETVDVHEGRLDEEEMARFLQQYPGVPVFDATHPYAALVSQNIREACAKAGNSYFRIFRESTFDRDIAASGGTVTVGSPEEAAAYLAGTEGNILLTTGSKELPAFSVLPRFAERVYARMLPIAGSLEICGKLGLPGAHIIAMQGPFSAEMNCALIHHTGASFLVTKDTGKAGGFPEKAEAAASCGCTLVVIGRPNAEEEGMSVEDCLNMLSSGQWSRR